MSKIFLIPGLGADTRIYNNIDLAGHEVICVDWIEPSKTDTLASYAQKLVYQYYIPKHCAIIVKDGTHIMIFEKAKEINKILKRILKK